MSGRRSQRGATLVEALVAIAVLGMGTAAVTNLITSISGARRKMAFQTSSLELFNRLNSEIQASTCLVYPGSNAPTVASTDAALFAVATAATWQSVPIGAHVVTVGDFLEMVPPMRVEYRVDLAPLLAINGVPDAQPRAYDVVVRVREITRDAARDAQDVMSGHHIRTWPIRKSCALRGTADGRGAF